MANTREGNVIKVDTTASFPEALQISSIKYIGAASGTAVITDYLSAKSLWQEAGTANVHNHVDIRVKDGITVTTASGAAVYIYLRV